MQLFLMVLLLTFVKKNTDSSKTASVICCLLEIISPLSPLKKSPFLTYSISGVLLDITYTATYIFLYYLHGSEPNPDDWVLMFSFLNYLYGSKLKPFLSNIASFFLNYLYGSKHHTTFYYSGLIFLNYLYGSKLINCNFII